LRIHRGEVEQDVRELESYVVLGMGVCCVVAEGRIPGEICSYLLHRSLLVSYGVLFVRMSKCTYINWEFPTHPDKLSSIGL
jgi:hypothetical protein